MAQVTKPMALDETLQDVVAALQNITQGGHIVYSGTVGSTTQPIYLNAGVPTAGSNVLIYDEKNNVDLNTIKTAGQYGIQGGAGANLPPAADKYGWLFVSEYRRATMNEICQIFLSEDCKQAFVRYFWDSGPEPRTWSDWKGIYGIQTGTPTNINTNLSLDSSNSRIQKSGNVVCFKLQFNISTTYTPSSVLDNVCTLPYKPKGWENVNRLLATSGHGSAVMGQGFLSSSGTLCIGTSPYTGLTAGNEMVFTGTYMTDD